MRQPFIPNKGFSNPALTWGIILISGALLQARRLYMYQLCDFSRLETGVAMAAKSKNQYLTKKVKFGGKDMTLYSLDGMTWSSREGELEEIQARHEREKVTINDITGAAEVVAGDEEKAKENDERLEMKEFEEELELEEIRENIPRRGRPPKAGRPAKLPASKAKAASTRKVPRVAVNPGKGKSRPAGAAKAQVMPLPKSRKATKPAKQAVAVKGKKKKAA